MTEAVNVLLVETDELELHERVEQLLMDGYAVDAVAITEQARVRLADGPDALILCGEPQTIGLLRELRAGEIPRADSTTWVLVVGADDDSAAVRYYRAGADVALPSESSPLLVAAGLEALVRRTGPPQTRIIRVGSLTVDRDARTAHVDGRAVKLTRLEFDLLATLARDPRRTFTRAELTREVWTYDPHATGPSRTVHSHVHRLRHKLEQAGRPGNGADGARGRMEAHPMTDTQPAVAGALGRACPAPACVSRTQFLVKRLSRSLQPQSPGKPTLRRAHLGL
jgi:DNA-binding response OmpR family regulator